MDVRTREKTGFGPLRTKSEKPNVFWPAFIRAHEAGIETVLRNMQPTTGHDLGKIENFSLAFWERVEVDQCPIVSQADNIRVQVIELWPTLEESSHATIAKPILND